MLKRTSKRRLKAHGRFLPCGGYITNDGKLFIGSDKNYDWSKFPAKHPIPENINNKFHVQTLREDETVGRKWIKKKNLIKFIKERGRM